MSDSIGELCKRHCDNKDRISRWGGYLLLICLIVMIIGAIKCLNS